MTRKYFGTDGIRGRTNTAKLTPEVAMKAGMAAGRIFTHGDHRHRVVIGKDTRLSGYMIESALVSGFTAVNSAHDGAIFPTCPQLLCADLSPQWRPIVGA